MSAKKKEEKGKKYPLEKWQCTLCYYIYDPAKGDPDFDVKPGTSFEALPDNWSCPGCGSTKDLFKKLTR